MAPSDNAYPSDATWPGNFPPVRLPPTAVTVTRRTTGVQIKPHTSSATIVVFDLGSPDDKGNPDG